MWISEGTLEGSLEDYVVGVEGSCRKRAPFERSVEFRWGFLVRIRFSKNFEDFESGSIWWQRFWW